MVGYCPICGKPVYFGEKKRSLGREYHPLCLKCQQCQRQLTPGQHAEHDEKPYCTNCYMKTFGPRGKGRMMSYCHSSGSSSSSSS
ncbi:cysteine-rich protein 1 isoform X2 [Coregonus clupeaformis]|uniref:cysteine-rich protein 1 isoform X2 n=1 Tax=Coregonus clupeaformis TaxID=59861 RepID=UPI001BDFEB62|nr:cysteine-rich protein 1 isoform X2 [Coregonus clupeaformis]